VNDDKIIQFITSIESNNVCVPYVVSKIFEMVADDSIVWNIIPDRDKTAMAYMSRVIYNFCFDLLIENRLSDNYYKYGSVTIYNVDAANGMRAATANEVRLGIEGLIPQEIYPAGEDSFKNLCLMLWLATGKQFYFKQAGYELRYDAGGRVENTVYEMLQASCRQIADIAKWVQDGTCEKAIKIINKFKRNGGYKYAEYAKDEIYEPISIKQLIKNIDTEFPRNSNNISYRKAIAYVIKTNRNDVRLTPLEISELRRIYKDFLREKENSNGKDTAVVNNELKQKCERLDKASLAGLIDRKHFAFKIIKTLKANNYTRCSEKQMKYIDDAIAILDDLPSNKQQAKDSEVITEDYIDDTIDSLAHIIESGIFE
jgi:hypothetical protein